MRFLKQQSHQTLILQLSNPCLDSLWAADQKVWNLNPPCYLLFQRWATSLFQFVICFSSSAKVAWISSNCCFCIWISSVIFLFVKGGRRFIWQAASCLIMPFSINTPEETNQLHELTWISLNITKIQPHPLDPHCYVLTQCTCVLALDWNLRML